MNWIFAGLIAILAGVAFSEVWSVWKEIKREGDGWHI